MGETSRSCGSCTLCCKVLGVEEFDKPVGVWCSHCAPGRGCKAYDQRPATCRAFSCLWLLDSALPDAFRPDRCKVVLGSSSRTVMVAWCDPADPLAWRREPTYSLLKRRAADLSKPVIITVRSGSHMWIVRQGQDIDVGHVDPKATVRFDPEPGGGVRAVVLPPTAARGPVAPDPSR